jgi:hypothetical protein
MCPFVALGAKSCSRSAVKISRRILARILPDKYSGRAIIN